MTMKVFVGAVAAAAALALSTGTVEAAPGQTQTVTQHNGPIADSVPVTCAGGFTGTTSFSGIGNSITHMNFNNNGGWMTSTEEGTVTLVITPLVGAASTYYGHVQDWNAGEGNRQTFVVHATLNFDGTNVVDGTAFHLHANYDVTTNHVVYPPSPAPPVGVTTASHLDVSCS